MKIESLAFTTNGSSDASALVLASSLGTTGDMWLPQLDILAQQWRVVRFDHPGHGHSAGWDGPVTVASIGVAVIELLDRLGVDRVSFCGLSLGGAVGQWLAAHAPERIERLILCSTSARFAAPEAYRQRAAVVRERGMAPIAGAVIERWFTPDFRSRQSDVVAQYRSMLEAIPPEGYAACCEAVAAFDGRDELASITAPTLVIGGAHDQATPVEHARALVDGIPGARMTTIQRAAHLANIEQPAAVGQAIVHHLRGTA